MSKPSSRGKPLATAAERGDDRAQGAVVSCPSPGARRRAGRRCPAHLPHVVVDQRRQQIVRGADGVEFAGEVRLMSSIGTTWA
jgi:hypothetical protein